ncbi:hypothetical protein [Bradyrhizobium sp. Tv2a-2]|uniref:hypothetical protein n=1 Tax=Bradyrhizobium sp. Tv2a-2 TaxID=113395 RepID=UPI0004144C17|nr:hypothetical protein [Bradyrhizobium sp. Tv2a-2]
MTTSNFDGLNPKFAPLFDVDAATGVGIEAFYGDRTLETFRQGRCRLVLTAASAWVRAYWTGWGVSNELFGVPRRDDAQQAEAGPHG